MRKLLITAAACVLFISCQQNNSEEENKKIVLNIYEEIINKKQVGQIDTYYVENAVDHSAWPGQSPGTKGLKEVITDFHKSYSNLRVNVDEIIAKDDKVITRETWSGVSNATKEADSGTVMHIFKLKNGKVTDEWSEGWEWLQ